MIELTSAMVGMLGAKTLQVLIVLMIERGPRSLSFICDMANQSDKTASNGIRKLKTLGLITETGRYTYQIASGVEQLPLSADLLPEAAEESDANVSGRKISDLALNESMNQTNNDSEFNLDSLIDADSSEFFRAELVEFGFYGRGLAEMLKIPGLTLGEVRYQVEHAPSLGAALARIRKRQPVPGLHSRDPSCGTSDGSKYISGEFADFIQH